MVTSASGSPNPEDPNATNLIYQIIERWAARTPYNPALLSPGRAPLSFQQLLALVNSTTEALQNFGLRRTDRIAAVLPSGPEAAVAFLASSSCAAYAPLNPVCKRHEFELYLRDLRPQALLLSPGDTDSLIRDVANTLEIPILDFNVSAGGDLSIQAPASQVEHHANFARAQSTNDALLLYTSGTTSRPKLVPLTHANICSALRANCKALELSPADRCLNVMPLFHIHGLIAAILSALAAGGSAVCCPEFNPNCMREWLCEFQPTWYSAPSAIHRDILDRLQLTPDEPLPATLRFIRVGSTTIKRDLVERLENTFRAPVIEAYGMTEAGPLIASNPLPPATRKQGSVGLPAGTQVAILDSKGVELGANCEGEIGIRGPNVTRGYNDSEVNREAFLNGWFRTGDLGYIDSAGFIYLTGRKKDQINRGGEKVSPREVEDRLNQHDSVREAYVFPAPDARLGEEVAAAAILKPDAAVTERELREYCARHLADFKIPRRILFLDKLPEDAFTPSRKLQRAKLADLLGIRFDLPEIAASEHVQAETPTELLLSKIWTTVLGVASLGIDDHFLNAGGNSLLAAQLLSRVRSEAGIDLSIIDLFDDAPTIRRMAKRIDSAIPRLFDNNNIGEKNGPQISHAQERLWFIDRLHPGTSIYNLRKTLRLTGPLEINILKQSLLEIIRKHEVLRTTFGGETGNPVPIVHAQANLVFSVTDLPDAREPDLDAHLAHLVAAEFNRPFDLTHDLMFRAALFRIRKDECILVLTVHHIAGDAWSWTMLLKELAANYAALKEGNQFSPPEFVPVTYSELAARQRLWLNTPVASEQLKYWCEKLAGAPDSIALPMESAKPFTASHEGKTRVFTLNGEMTAALRNLSQRHNATLFMTLLAAFKALLYRYSSQEDIVVGVPVAGRTTPDSENVVGLFVNTLAFREDLSGNPTFTELLTRVRRTTLEALSHSEIPFDHLVKMRCPARELGRNPLFQVMFDLRNVEQPPANLADLAVEPLWFDNHTALFDLTLTIVESPSHLDAYLEYKTDLFKPETIERMVEHFENLIKSALAQPTLPIESLSLLGDSEFHRIVYDWNSRTIKYPKNRCVQHLFEVQAQRRPTVKAVIGGAKSLTYRELDQRSNQLARYLRLNGIRADSRVAVCMDRSPELLVAILGVLKSGGAYIPLDPQTPSERLRFVLEETEPKLVIGESIHRSVLETISSNLLLIDSEREAIELESSAPVRTDINLETTAYILYTSGSTGRPKGVSVTHGNLINAYWAWEDEYQLHDRIRTVLQGANHTFDVFTGDLVRALCSGSTLVLCPREILLMPEQLYAILREHSIEFFETIPAVLRNLAEWMERTSNLLPDLKILIAGSDILYARDYVALRHVFCPATRILNTYGVTEATIDSTYFDGDVYSTDSEAVVPIGRPFPNTRIYILNSAMQPQPIGVTGELYIGGAGVSRGHIHRPELTAEHFISDPFVPGACIYRTGDLARFRADGNIDYLGRSDTQIKIRGFRIELNEIECVLRTHPEIREAVVVPLESKQSGVQLVAHLVCTEPPPDPSAIRSFLGELLPDYMVPTHYSFLDAMPLTPNGKIDRKKLQSMAATTKAIERALRSPANPVEERILAIWQETLGLPCVSIDDNFFEIGGHSLLAASLIHKLQTEFNCDITLRALFESPTVNGLAKRIGLHDGPDSALFRSHSLKTLVIDPGQQHDSFLLTPIQEAYWIGRGASFELGNIASHSYKEIDVRALDVTRLESALNKLIARHGMLRAVIHSDGRQQIIHRIPVVHIPIEDLRELDESTRTCRLNGIRHTLSERNLPLDTAPLLEIRATRISDAITRLHFCIDGLIIDALSDRIFIHELHHVYETPDAKLPPLELSFRDYVLADQACEHNVSFQRAREYWLNKLPSLPPGPELPLAKSPSAIEKPQFTRRSTRFNAATWRSFKQTCSERGITPSAGLLTAYARILQTWSSGSRFTLNLTIYNRAPLHPDVNRLIGNFTSLSLLGIDLSPGQPFADHARAIQKQLWEDLDHRQFDGIRVLRELARQRGNASGALMPVVFTSVLNFAEIEHANATWELFGNIVWSQNQTPQVWLDSQAIEDRDELIINWDAVEALFPDLMLDDMFAAYTGLIESLATGSEAWQHLSFDLLPERQLRQRSIANATGGSAPAGLLHTAILDQCDRQPQQTAVISTELTLTYSDLQDRARSLAAQLKDAGAKPNELVAIVMEKGWAQVVAAFGILQCGAAYLPIDVNAPIERIHFLLNDADVRNAVTTSELNEGLAWPDHIQRHLICPHSYVSKSVRPPVTAQANDLAYVIYTSGSTGKPKGVMIDHRGALNTIVDINERFSVSEHDRVLALSALSFDLSVYDIFGLLSAGGAVVIPESREYREPAHWAELIRRHQITIWNSVPAFMEMMAHYSEETAQAPFESLRLVMLSGDWIPLHLPEKIRRLAPNARIISLGGATEASIWSILYPIDDIDRAWKSIPYGKPMKNQTFHVLNASLEPCPDWAPGDLYIGGIGLAQGYWKNPEKTQASFIHHSRSGERLYKTGDIGRYLRDGNIEFLGRQDLQVKIRGFRIELGEIEAALNQHPDIAESVVTVHDDGAGKRRLVGYVVPKEAVEPALETLRSHLQRTLPDYMIPSAFVILESLPLSANGKVDRHQLPPPAEEHTEVALQNVPPHTPTQEFLAGIWKRVLSVNSVGIDDNFFDLGGDSIHAIQVISEIQKQYQIDLNLFTLFETPTIAGLSDTITRKQVEMTDETELAHILGEVEALAAETASSNSGSNGALEHHLGLEPLANEPAQGSNFETDT